MQNLAPFRSPGRHGLQGHSGNPSPFRPLAPHALEYVFMIHALVIAAVALYALVGALLA
jgi:hypothetical protein